MERICERKNLNRAYKRVKANRGSPGVDGMTVGELGAWLAAHKEELVANLLDGSYRSRVVRGVEIPNPGEGYAVVVDMDLEKFFDRVNHDVLMGRLARRIADKRLLRIIRRFLEAGIMRQGVVMKRRGDSTGRAAIPLACEPPAG